MDETKIRERLNIVFAEAAEIAARRFPNDYDAALRYARDLLTVQIASQDVAR